VHPNSSKKLQGLTDPAKLMGVMTRGGLSGGYLHELNETAQAACLQEMHHLPLALRVRYLPVYTVTGAEREGDPDEVNVRIREGEISTTDVSDLPDSDSAHFSDDEEPAGPLHPATQHSPEPNPSVDGSQPMPPSPHPSVSPSGSAPGASPTQPPLPTQPNTRGKRRVALESAP